MTCPVYKKVRQALSYRSAAHETADSVCRLARKYGINPNMSAWEIIDEVNMRNAQNKFPPSTDQTPNISQIRDKTYPPPSYGNDYSSCLESLKGLGVNESRAIEECEAQWKGEGTRIGKDGWYTNTAAKARSASIVNEVPYWATVAAEEAVTSRHRNERIYNSNLRSASLDELKDYHNAIAITTIAETLAEREQERHKESVLRSAKVEAEYDSKKPGWALGRGL